MNIDDEKNIAEVINDKSKWLGERKYERKYFIHFVRSKYMILLNHRFRLSSFNLPICIVLQIQRKQNQLHDIPKVLRSHWKSYVLKQLRNLNNSFRSVELYFDSKCSVCVCKMNEVRSYINYSENFSSYSMYLQCSRRV